MRRYHKRSFQVPDPLVDVVVAELWARGILGLELIEGNGQTRIDAYFEKRPPAPLLEEERWRRRGVLPLGEGWLDDQDWLKSYREWTRPFPLGAHFVVDPREPQAAADPAERILLRLPARRAFGIGSHASTQLAVEALEELPLERRRILDVGTGTAILSFVMLHRGARWVVGFDREVEAVLVAHENRRLNDSWPALFAGRLAAIGSQASFDLIVVNVLPERIAAELEALVSLLEPDGRMVVSGLLESERSQVEARYESLGLVVCRRWSKEEWACLLLERGAA